MIAGFLKIIESTSIAIDRWHKEQPDRTRPKRDAASGHPMRAEDLDPVQEKYYARAREMCGMPLTGYRDQHQNQGNLLRF